MKSIHWFIVTIILIVIAIGVRQVVFPERIICLGAETCLSSTQDFWVVYGYSLAAWFGGLFTFIFSWWLALRLLAIGLLYQVVGGLFVIGGALGLMQVVINGAPIHIIVIATLMLLSGIGLLWVFRK